MKKRHRDHKKTERVVLEPATCEALAWEQAGLVISLGC
jgi:hypothetical protein